MNKSSAFSFSGEEDQGVALWNINKIGTKILQLHLGLLKVLKIDGHANARVTGDNIVLAVLVVDVGRRVHLVERVLALSRVDGCSRA